MYRSNQRRGVSPRDRLDPRLLERLALRSEMPSDIGEDCGCRRMTNRSNGCGCGENEYARESRHNQGNCGCSEDTLEERLSENDGCGCENYNAEFDYSLAMVYPPMQQWQNLYCEEEGLSAGTIFRELDKPFYGAKCHGGNTYE